MVDEQQKMQILADLVAIKSVNGHELKVAEYLEKLLTRYGIQAEILPLGNDRANLVATLGEGKPVLGIGGHMDVVDVEPAGWKTDPFVMTQAGDNLYGRGVNDMKDGLAAIVIAMIEIKQSGVPLPGTLKFLASAGEEVGQVGAQALTKAGYVDDLDALLICEPTGYRIISANKGTLNLTVKSHGKAAHSSMPKLGNNAATHLLNILQRMQATFDDVAGAVVNPEMGGTLYNVDVLQAGNQVNAIPGLATAQINLRTIPELPNDQLIAAFQKTVDDYNATTNGDIELIAANDVISTQGNRDSDLIKLIQQIGNPYAANQDLSAEERAYEQQLMKLLDMPYAADEILAMSASGTMDASSYLIDHPVGFNYAAFGPGNDTQHQDNEYTSKRQYLEFIAIYKKLFVQYLQVAAKKQVVED
ncbi:succinyl-diaminopimelate desuccinylase [Lactiplantibacillus fabifermentans DSM 21115]|uniref:Probable succinyl-diaminopimelate desuccinylase n=1 Tax=Lactiplantibacillus fabifermentans DSM 21115 TaxID=1413187 RepID=A0A0R2P0X7_9LACO|nr:succinyl-diaminopimelate desuccinylase [Lactiplantibacillus fabifermentans DSM 21115]